MSIQIYTTKCPKCGQIIKGINAASVKHGLKVHMAFKHGEEVKEGE